MMPARAHDTEVPQIAPPADVKEPPPGAIKTLTSRERSQASISSRVVSTGGGTIHPGPHDTVTIRYTLWTTDGKTIDSSALRGQPSRWALDELVEGLRLGIALMITGETRRFWIPPDMAYDWANSTLVFDIELLQIDAMADAPSAADLLGPPADAPRTPGGVAYTVLKPSASVERPQPMSTVTIHYRGWVGREVFDDTIVRGAPLVVAIDTLMPGLADALPRMAVGEKTRFWIPPALAYTPPGPPASALMFDVELIAIQRAQPGQPGTIEVRTNSPDASYTLVRPDGSSQTLKGPQTVAAAPPGAYRIVPSQMRSYARGLLASPTDMTLAPAGRLVVTITYRAISQ